MKKFGWFLVIFGLLIGLEFIHSTIVDTRILAKTSEDQTITQNPVRIPLTSISQKTPLIDEQIVEVPDVPTVQSAPEKSSKADEQPKPAPAPLSRSTIQTATINSCGGTFAQEFLCLLNEYRESKGLSKLSYNSGLSKVALSHSEWMNANQTFSHEDGSGMHFVERCLTAGIVCHGENLAKGATSPQNLLDLWSQSPEHDEILLGKFTSMGIGVSGEYISLLLN